MGFWRMAKFSQENPSDSTHLTAAQLLSVALVSSAWALQSGGGSLPGAETLVATLTSDWHVAAALLWTGVVTTALTVAMETLALRRLSAAESTVIFSTEPLWGTAFAAALLGEQAGWNTGAGAVLILCACLWSTLKKPLPLKGAATAGVRVCFLLHCA
jgi:drug/metabolite transporter (DMT)-like permease